MTKPDTLYSCPWKPADQGLSRHGALQYRQYSRPDYHRHYRSRLPGRQL